MKKKWIGLSLLGHLALLAVIFWMLAEHHRDLMQAIKISMRGDEKHIQLHARSLAALESQDPDQVEEALTVLRLLVPAGLKNIEQRKQSGIWD